MDISMLFHIGFLMKTLAAVGPGAWVRPGVSVNQMMGRQRRWPFEAFSTLVTLKLSFLAVYGLVVLCQGHRMTESLVAGLTGIRPLISGVGTTDMHLQPVNGAEEFGAFLTGKGILLAQNAATFGGRRPGRHAWRSNGARPAWPNSQSRDIIRSFCRCSLLVLPLQQPGKMRAPRKGRSQAKDWVRWPLGAPLFWSFLTDDV
jgi:hypothetical protein